jgi:hypothetical protein
MENKSGVHFEVTQWFYITKGLPDCVVLGDALFKDQRQHVADISQYHRHLTIKGHVVPYVEMRPHFHMYMSERETLPAGAKVKCFLTRLVKADGEKFSGVGTVCDRVDVTGVHIHPQDVFTWAEGGVWVYLINKTKRTITLTHGQSVACFQSTSDLDEKVVVKTFTSSQRESTDSKLATNPSGKLGGDEAKVNAMRDTSVDSAGSNHSATCGHASAAGADSTACGYGSGLSLLESAPRVCTEEAEAVTWMNTFVASAELSAAYEHEKEPILLQRATEVCTIEARVTHALNASAVGAGVSVSTNCGYASAVSEVHAACGWMGTSVLKGAALCTEEAGAGKFYGYCHPAYESVDVEGDIKQTPRKRGVPSVFIAQAAVCVEEMKQVSNTHLPFFDQSFRKTGGVVSECVTLSTSQSGRRCKCKNERMVPEQRIDLTRLDEAKVSFGRHSQDVATDTTLNDDVSMERAMSLTGDLGVAAESARDLFEPDHLKYLETLMQNSLKIS